MSRLDSRLRARIARRFDTVTETLRIGDCEIRFTRIREPDRVLDDIAEEEDRREKLSGLRKPGDELHLPYWAELWDSAIGIGQHLLKRPPAQSVLDLGCGMGLAGAIAAARGSCVLLADLEPAALLMARLNTLAFGDRARVRRLDWRRDRLDESFEHILGSDVLYERSQWEHLEPFWRRHLRKGGTVLLGEPGRQTGEAFVEWIRERGWSLDEGVEPVPTRPQPIRIFTLRPLP